MLAAPALDLPSTATRKQIRWASLALSVALHLLLALAWLGFPAAEPRRSEERAVTVELTPEAPRPEQAKPKTAEWGDGKQAEGGADAKPIPQLEEGRLAHHSSPPTPKPEAAPPSPRAEAAPKPKKPAPVTQNERDFILGQVIRHWHPPKELAAYDKADVQVSVVVDAAGYFDGDYDARRRWNPDGVFEGYSTLPAQSIQRRTIDAFYQAIRKAQPVRLPPELKAKAPFPVRLDFRLKDAR